MIYIENEGALFRGVARAWPKEVWTGQAFVPYRGSVPKAIDWGNVIDESEALRLMQQTDASGHGAPSGSAT